MHLLLPVVVVAAAAGVPTDGRAAVEAAADYAHSPTQRSPQAAHSLLQWAVAVIAVRTEATPQNYSALTVLRQFSAPPPLSVAATAV